MQSSLTLVKRIVQRSTLLCLVFFSLLSMRGAAQTHAVAVSTPNPTVVTSTGHDPLVDAAFDHFYNLDYDRSIQEFEKIMDRRPSDPSAVNHLLTTVLMRELYRMGAMNSGEYANDSFIGEAHRTADPQVKERIKQLVERAENLEEQQLKANPDNVDALYARGVTRAQFALYTALVERAWFSAAAASQLSAASGMARRRTQGLSTTSLPSLSFTANGNLFSHVTRPSLKPTLPPLLPWFPSLGHSLPSAVE